ncbi:hypothetical protein [Flavivirga spongiicola]|uniref:Uncharacterized protein n=1 Tax=Flavivirga spongiicola TaxID=421621 RepID=A0ABU7XNN2_9FLAO|nr:hypothetical protein [Flavivirga sp. MEBiC05379]MDO5981795.1 hypothetical protein [Flavivirga sp. MEBiC05379]
MKKKIRRIIFIIAFVTSFQVFAHPGGNMIVVGKYVLWSYVSPINDTDHHACVMIWDPNSDPEILLKSEFPASDYMFSSNGDHIYIIEQRYLEKTDKFEIRILKTQIGEKLSEIWGWFEDKWRIGDGGFFMNSDQEIIFGRYPNIYSLKKGQNSKKYFKFDVPIKRIRAINNNQILLLGDSSCWLTDQTGKIIKEWTHLIDLQISDAPINRNQIFDADFKNGELLLAYWGKRSFDILNNDGTRKTIIQLKKPFVPHWVAYYGNEKLLFSSKLVFNGAMPKPNLILYKSDNENINIWKN